MLMTDSLWHATACQLASTIFLLAPHVPVMGFVPDTPADPDQNRRQKMWPSSLV